jgi:[ribosomal protein S5]-alanine N-acetyltransferase
MELQPITLAEDRSIPRYATPDCQELIAIYADYYKKIGYHPPWIGYFVLRDDLVVGSCSFTGQPKEGRVEIAYWTFKANEGQGIASFSCKALISLAKTTDPALIITAKTSPEHNASTRILEKNGFEFSGIVQDDEIGDAWEWIHKDE